MLTKSYVEQVKNNYKAQEQRSLRTSLGDLGGCFMDSMALNKISLWFFASHSGIYDINYN